MDRVKRLEKLSICSFRCGRLGVFQMDILIIFFENRDFIGEKLVGIPLFMAGLVYVISPDCKRGVEMQG